MKKKNNGYMGEEEKMKNETQNKRGKKKIKTGRIGLMCDSIGPRYWYGECARLSA